MRNQVKAALEMFAGATQTLIKVVDLCARPGGHAICGIFETHTNDQDLVRMSAQQILNVLDEFIQEADEIGLPCDGVCVEC